MSETIKVSIDDSGVAELLFDLPDESVNKLSTPVLEEFRKHLISLKNNSAIKLLLITSAKKNVFIAGADLEEIRSFDTPEEAAEKAAEGQRVMNQLEDLPCPTVAIINGACLGGGFELALACDFRLVSDNPKTVLGLPEVNLGFVPGFGGTWRLPRLVGLQQALGVILSGKSVNARKAWKLHIADKVLAREFLDEGVNDFCHSLLNTSFFGKGLKDRRKRPLGERLLVASPVRSLLFRKVRDDVLKKTKGFYPAPLKALELLEPLVADRKSALKKECRVFGELAVSEVSKNLVHVFFASESLKKNPGPVIDGQARELSSAGVIGAGVMGGGISWAFSNRDIPVRMKDLNNEALSKGFEAAAAVYRQLEKIHRLKPAQSSMKMQKISGSLDWSGFDSLDIVTEAIVENLDIKKKVLLEAEKKLNDNALLVSNTSSLSVNAMAKTLERPENFAGFHYFNPVNRMPLVEVIPGEKTSDNTIATLLQLARRLGKTPVVVQDCGGFLVNRLLIPILNEAAWLLLEGGDEESIDGVLSRFGMPMGPFVLADAVGVDIAFHVATELEKSYGDRMAVSPLLKAMFETKKLLGNKTGEGFYIHRGKDIFPSELAREVLSKTRKDEGIEARNLDKNEILDRCLLAMINEAFRALEEGVIHNAAALDMAMILGTGFPPFRGGPVRYAVNRGLSDVCDRLQGLSEKTEGRLTPTKLLLKLSETGDNPYEISHSSQGGSK